MAVFGVSVFFGFLVNIIGAYQTGDWHGATQAIGDLLKSVILPVVTLLLGYYFGRAGKD